MKKISMILIGCIISMLTSCKRFIEVKAPTTSVNGQNVYTENANAIAVMSGLLSHMSSWSGKGDVLQLSLVPELSADNLFMYDKSDLYLLQYFQNSLTGITTPTMPNKLWNNCYANIYTCNAAIEGITNSNTLTPNIKQQLLGEAYFLRAFCFFYLTNLYGAVPLTVSTDYAINTMLIRSPASKVYELIIADLNEAKSLLSINYLNGALTGTTDDRVRPTKAAAAALLARVYLFTKEYKKAEIESTNVILQTGYYKLEDTEYAFNKNTKETIWALQPVASNGLNTSEGNFFIPGNAGLGSLNPVYLNEELLKDFEEKDLRKEKWIKSVTMQNGVYFYSYKYKVKEDGELREYSIVLRIAEQLLIRAEARVEQNNISGAQEDLNAVRKRAGLDETKAVDVEALKEAILIERRHEFFTEWGHRWLDLKRTGNIHHVMREAAKAKGGIWDNYKALYPIDIEELKKAPNLTQNSGYQGL